MAGPVLPGSGLGGSRWWSCGEGMTQRVGSSPKTIVPDPSVLIPQGHPLRPVTHSMFSGPRNLSQHAVPPDADGVSGVQ